MRAARLLLALLLAAAAGDVRADQPPTARRDVLHGPTQTSGHLGLSGLTCAPALVCYPDADSWDCWDGAGASVAVTQGAGTGFESTPFIPTVGGTARYLARIDAAAKAPKLTDSTLTASLWASDHTVLYAGASVGTASAYPFSQGAANDAGLYSIDTATTHNCVWGGAGVNITLGHALANNRWMMNGCRKNGTTYSALSNGGKTNVVSATVITAGTGKIMWFGRDQAGTAGHPLGLFALFPCALTDAEVTRAGALWDGTVAEERNVPDVRASTAGWTAPDGYFYAKGDNSGRCDSRGCLSEESRVNYWLNSSSASSWANVITPVIGTNVASGPLSRYLGAAEVDTIEDDNAANYEGKTQSLALGPGTYTFSCALAAGTVTTAALQIGVTGGTGTGTGLVSGLGAAFTTPSFTTTAGAGTTAIGPILYPTLQSAAADVGSVNVAECQLEAGAFPTSHIPTGAASVTRAADKFTVSTTGWPTATGRICYAVTPEWTTPSADSYVWDSRTGTNGTACWADSSRRLNCSTGTAGATTAIQSAALTWTGGEHEVCLDWRDGNLVAEFDHAVVASSFTGAGNMPTAHAASAGHGSTAAGASQFNGWVSLKAVSR